jgi:hypothetical protein
MSADKRLESLSIIRDMLLQMMARADSSLERYGPSVQKTFSDLQIFYPKAPDRMVAKMLDSLKSAELLDMGMYIYLEAVEKGTWILPVLSFKIDLRDEKNPEVRLRVGIIMAGDEKLGRDTCAIGFRFETPEGRSGLHNYYHAQPFRRFKEDGRILPQCPEWFPDVHPAIPLGAHDEIGLLVCCLTSIYGPDLLNDLVANLPFSSRKRLSHASKLIKAA